MAAYYNEIDPFAAAWLRELIKRNLIAPGDVDERSIEDVRPDDLRGYTQCHFFAGIGGWSYALRLAGWPDDRPVWTGSCPCQPFSTAGKRKGVADERHLWPAFFHLIHECRPVTVFGEQVASKDGLSWLDLVQADMEGAGYAVGAVDTCAAGFGAPHIRQRLYWVALGDAQNCGRFHRELGNETGSQCRASGTGQDERRGGYDAPDDGGANWVAHSCGPAGQWHSEELFRAETESRGAWQQDGRLPERHQYGGAVDELAHSPEFRCQCDSKRTQVQGRCAEREGQHSQPGYAGELSGGFEGCCGLGNTQDGGRENESTFHGSAGSRDESGCGWRRAGRPGAAVGRMGNNNSTGLERLSGDVGAATGRQEPVGQTADSSDDADGTMPTNGFWRNPDWLWCRDKKWRPVKSGLSPLVDELPEGMGRGRDFRAISQRLKGYGNAIVAPQAAEIIKVFMEVLENE